MGGGKRSEREMKGEGIPFGVIIHVVNVKLEGRREGKREC